MLWLIHTRLNRRVGIECNLAVKDVPHGPKEEAFVSLLVGGFVVL